VLQVSWTDALEVAHQIEALGAELIARAARLGLLGAALAPTAVLSPGTAAAAELAIAAGAAGPVGLATVGASLGGTATTIRQVITTLGNVDEELGFVLRAAETSIGATVRSWHGPLARAGRATIAEYAGTEGPAAVAAIEPGTATAAPRRLSDLLARLTGVAAQADGTIGIEALAGKDGVRRYVVYLPGTDSADRSAVRSWPTNASIRLGHPTTYQAGVMAAMTAAGIGPGDPVLLVGHSQGGMVAAEIARSPGPFTISEIVTAGSPIGDRMPPEGTGLIALEHTGDLVPTLDGDTGHDTENQRRLTFSDGLGGPVGNHRLAHYVRGAQAAETSLDPSVVRVLAGLDPFLTGTADSETSTWLISRADE